MSLRILYSVRLFSGLDHPVQVGRWEPTGVPTIFKVMEALDQGPHALHFVLSAPDGTSPWIKGEDVTLTLERFRACLVACAVPYATCAKPGRWCGWRGGKNPM
jgi:hypothetical protein